MCKCFKNLLSEGKFSQLCVLASIHQYISYINIVYIDLSILKYTQVTHSPVSSDAVSVLFSTADNVVISPLPKIFNHDLVLQKGSTEI